MAGLAFSPQPTIGYSLRIDPDHLDVVEVAIRLDNAPNTLRLAMKVHPSTTRSTGDISTPRASRVRPTISKPASPAKTARSGA
jgi:hypothetical protein